MISGSGLLTMVCVTLIPLERAKIVLQLSKVIWRGIHRGEYSAMDVFIGIRDVDSILNARENQGATTNRRITARRRLWRLHIAL